MCIRDSLTTNKGWCEGHKLRQEIWYALEEYDEINDFEVWKKRTPPSIPNKNVALENAKFTISLENSEINNYFSEKLLDCFETKTIPLYWGCPNVSSYFNMDGILHFHTIEEMEEWMDTMGKDYGEENTGVANIANSLDMITWWALMTFFHCDEKPVLNALS